MIDRYDQITGFTSMARTTAFTGAIVARLVARGEVQIRGLVTPEQVITGPLFDRLIAKLAAVNIHFILTSEIVEALNPPR
jgi:saccharopine dehydrogenase-like NADP-dependent oxidoreductase